ncbi:MAG: GNAT family N-acyltransferase, partial [bacterium]|nr:GNAT family N-acyltransferase [bacterium]
MKLIAKDRNTTEVGRRKRGRDTSELIREGDLLVKKLDRYHEKVLNHQLRYRIFCQELGWVPENESHLEVDEYDDHAVCFGVFEQKSELLASMRLIKPE